MRRVRRHHSVVRHEYKATYRALRKAQQELKTLYDQGNHQEYARRIGDCYASRPEGWKRAVEEVLLQDCHTAV